MKLMRSVFILVLLLAAIFIIGGLFLPKTHHISRSIEISRPDSVVYQFVLDYQHFKQWSPWYKMEPAAATTIMGLPGKPGYTYAWSGKELGKGKIELIKALPNQQILQEMTFYMPKPSVHQTNFYFESTSPGSTKVSWTMEGSNEGFFDNWMYTVFLNRMIGKEYETGLKSLKQVLEK